jgi:hypothetical protein
MAGIEISGCASYTLTTEQLVAQLKKSPTGNPKKRFQRYAYFKYTSNNLDSLKCLDKTNKEKSVFIDYHTLLHVHCTDTGIWDYVLYFDTVTLKGDTLVGYTSHIAADKVFISLKKIQKITLKIQYPRITY